jgi:ribose transport system permease protein
MKASLPSLETKDGGRPDGASPSSLDKAAGPLMWFAGTFRHLPMLPVVIVAFVLFSMFVDGFASVPNFQNIMRQLSVILAAVAGETLVLLIGGIDLSVGAIVGFASICGAFTMHATGSVSLGLLACVGTGLLIGALNGLGIAYARLQPFIMTFGVMLTVRALSFLLTAGRSVGRLPPPLLLAGRTNIAGIPLIFIIGLCVACVIGVVLHQTVFGQSVYLAGSNKRAARFSGIDVRRLEFQIFALSGALAGVAGFLFMMRLGAATPAAGDPLLLQIIGAAVLGGTSLNGGEGGILRSITGCLLIAMLNDSLELYGAQFWDQMIVVGALIALGSALGSWLSRRRSSELRGDPGERKGRKPAPPIVVPDTSQVSPPGVASIEGRPAAALHAARRPVAEEDARMPGVDGSSEEQK